MRFNFSMPVTQLDGTPIMDNAGEILTFDRLAIQLLQQGDTQDSAESKYNQYLIGMKIAQSPQNVTLKAEQVAELKKIIGKQCVPLVVGRFWDLLENPIIAPEDALADRINASDP